MGLTFPDPTCSTSPTNTHYWVEVIHSVFQCRYCWAAMWQPRTYYQAVDFTEQTRLLGLQEAYQRKVGRITRVKDALVMLNALKTVRDTVSTERQLELMAQVMAQYDIKDPDPYSGVPWKVQYSKPRAGSFQYNGGGNYAY